MLSGTERVVMRVLLVFALGADLWSCAGFPVYDYDPASLREALRASVAKVNSQSLSPYLLRAFRSSLRRVNALDEDTVVMNLEFSLRETTCRADSGGDPSSCAFQRGYYVPTVTCRSTVQMSAEQVQGVWARCHWSSMSDSDSSEEMIFGDMVRAYTWRNEYPLGLTRDEPRSERLYDPSLETVRRTFPPGNGRFPNYQRRARISTVFE
ncbi:secreted phosphoprotein 24 isoform X1 [Lepus europaeus]|uniref:secreted phosphoprotein 24 isoform X1 n=1 Tax=Lepus europaeus TaxID=9983 RepID=UPI002B49C676|nr:secreted phosphoprotein 24 isoform X1 [Lepus europaeus]